MRARYKRYEYVMHTEYNSNALPVPIMEPRLSPAQASFYDANSKYLWVLSERSVLGVSESTVQDPVLVIHKEAHEQEHCTWI